MTGLRNAQCTSYFAPSATHCLRVCRSDSRAANWPQRGGISSSASSAKIRRTSSLSSGFPGTIGRSPELAGFVADSSWSSAQFGLAALVVGTVALEAMASKDRPHLVAEIDGGLGQGASRLCPRAEGESQARPSTTKYDRDGSVWHGVSLQAVGSHGGRGLEPAVAGGPSLQQLYKVRPSNTRD